MKNLLSEIKRYAINACLRNMEEEFELPHKYEKDKTILQTLNNLLPQIEEHPIKGRVDEIETKGYPSSGDYYPTGSYFRISIIYSGYTNNGDWFFRNMTVHYTKEMNLISVQGHHNQKEYNWLETFEKVEKLFV